jgi:hypothetical protein
MLIKDSVSHAQRAGFFTPENSLVQVGGFHLVRGRRIDYVLVRGRPQGPTLQVRSCERVLVDPVPGSQGVLA